jgi:hypothetical protein
MAFHETTFLSTIFINGSLPCLCYHIFNTYIPIHFFKQFTIFLLWLKALNNYFQTSYRCFENIYQIVIVSNTIAKVVKCLLCNYISHHFYCVGSFTTIFYSFVQDPSQTCNFFYVVYLTTIYPFLC